MRTRVGSPQPSAGPNDGGTLMRLSLERLGLRCLGPVEPDVPEMIVALMIGELKYQSTPNPITTRIVRTTVKIWQSAQSAMLVCEAEPMAHLASLLGVPRPRMAVAVPGLRGHTTRKVAEWLRATDSLPNQGCLWVVTHLLHACRARRIFERCRVPAVFLGLDCPFSPGDPDWKLRSALRFRLYNLGAALYCRCRGWL